jgi:hypothetical protein
MPKTVDQLVHPAVALVKARPALFHRQGNVAESWRRCGERTFGPYYRLSYREDGRQKSLYLGRAGKLVEQVRQTLFDVKNAFRKGRAWQECRRQVLEKVREHKERANVLLRSLGLRMKGNEVRGWRTSPIRPLLQQANALLARQSGFHWGSLTAFGAAGSACATKLPSPLGLAQRTYSRLVSRTMGEVGRAVAKVLPRPLARFVAM